MKVLEVLDQIFCQHGERRRYSSTIYPSLELLIDQLEYISNVVYIPNVFQYLETAIAELKTLQDATQSTYGDSSLLQPYIFFFAGIQEKGVESLGAFAGPNRAAVTEKLNACKSKLETHENQMKTFTNQQAAPAEAIPTIDEATPADQPVRKSKLFRSLFNTCYLPGFFNLYLFRRQREWHLLSQPLKSLLKQEWRAAQKSPSEFFDLFFLNLSSLKSLESKENLGQSNRNYSYINQDKTPYYFLAAIHVHFYHPSTVPKTSTMSCCGTCWIESLVLWIFSIKLCGKHGYTFLTWIANMKKTSGQ